MSAIVCWWGSIAPPVVVKQPVAVEPSIPAGDPRGNKSGRKEGLGGGLGERGGLRALGEGDVAPYL